MVVNNITVMLFMTSVTLQICRYLPLEPVPLIVGEVCCANMMGAATLIGAPPNLLMAGILGYGFGRVTLHMAPLVFICTAVFMVVFYFQYRSQLILSRHPHPPLAGDPLFRSGSSVAPRQGHSGLLAWRIFLKIDFETLTFFMGLFILVGALDHVGVFQMLAYYLARIQNPVTLALTTLWVSALISALVDNIPMALAMAYLIKKLTVVLGGVPSGILVWATLIGLTLGGNMTPIGASPNVVAYGVLEKRKIGVGWKVWAQLTVPPTLAALGMASFLMWIEFRSGWY